MWIYRYFTISCVFTQLLADVKWIPKKASGKSGHQSGRCVAGCLSCSAVNGCLSCHPLLFLYLHRDGMRQRGTCLHTCPKGYYGIRRRHYSKCARCAVPNCEACFSRTHCTSCTAPYLAHRGKCIEECPDNLFYAEYTKECKERVDCMVSPWSVWDSCQRKGQICGYKYGTSDRRRDVIQAASPNGLKCPALTESRRCRLKYRTCADLLNNNSDPSRTLIPNKYARRKGKGKGKGRQKGRKGKRWRRPGKKWERAQKPKWNKIGDGLFPDRRRVSSRKKRKERQNMDSKLALTTNQITALAVV